MDKLYDLLMKIKKCPSLYIGEPSLERLRAFITGYHMYEHSVLNVSQPDCLDGFTKYIANYYGITHDYDWATIIQNESKSKSEAFNNFFDHLAVYLNQNK